MPARPSLDEQPTAANTGDPSASGQEENLAARVGQAAAHGEVEAESSSSPRERLEAERTERRRQRALVHETRDSAHKPERPHDATRVSGRHARPSFRDSASVTLIVGLAAGAMLGAILSSLSVAGWLIGLLVAGLTIVASAAGRAVTRSK